MLVVPTPSPFANHNNINITGEEETMVLPKYMQSKLAAVPDDGSAKLEKALKEKQELELKARPLHLQHELNQKFSGYFFSLFFFLHFSLLIF